MSGNWIREPLEDGQMGRNYTQTSRESILGSRRTKGKNKDKHFVESLGLIYVQVYYTWLLLHGLYLIVIGVVSNAVGYPTTRYTTSYINVVTDPVAYRTTRYTTSHINVVTDPVRSGTRLPGIPLLISIWYRVGLGGIVFVS